MINIELEGGLGNQMFMYATCRSIAEKYSYNYYIHTTIWDNKLLRFNLPMGRIDGYLNKQLNENWCVEYLHKNNKIPNEFWNISNNTKLKGYFQHYEFFDFNYNNIKKWFNTDKIIDNPILINGYNPYTGGNILPSNDKIYINLYNKYKDYCFIHIRGGDYLDRYPLPTSYYIKSMEIILNLEKDIKFIIITNDINYSKSIFPDIECLYNEDNLIDFKLLQTTKYLISSNSTFSWWAGYLNENAKKIIYPFGGLIYGKDTPLWSKCNKFEYI
jgi:hypothetical protein